MMRAGKGRKRSLVALAVLILAVAAFPAHAQTQAPARRALPERFTAQSLVEKLSGSFGIARNEAAPPLLPIGYSLIMEFEGWSAKHYDDVAYNCTLGYGHLVATRRCTPRELVAPGISRTQGLELLRNDVRFASSAVLDLVEVELNDEQYSALSSFVFNIGVAKFEDSTLLRLLNQELYEEAADQFSRWRWAGGRPQNGLIARRACETALFLGELSLEAGRQFRRVDCTSLGIATAQLPPIDILVGERQ